MLSCIHVEFLSFLFMCLRIFYVLLKCFFVYSNWISDYHGFERSVTLTRYGTFTGATFLKIYIVSIIFMKTYIHVNFQIFSAKIQIFCQKCALKLTFGVRTICDLFLVSPRRGASFDLCYRCAPGRGSFFTYVTGVVLSAGGV